MTDRPPHIIGMMTGTSLDALDAALVSINGSGFSMKPRLVDTRSIPLGPLADPLRKLAENQPMTARDITQLNNDFSDLHAQVVQDIRAHHDIRLIAVHGQTILHDPPLSWQLINPTRIAVPTGIPVVSDLRAADLAAGGQGAPITPLADAILFGDPKQTTAVINLGGFCNITIIPPGLSRMENLQSIQGFDCCACNHLLNTLSRRLLDKPFDDDGAVAQTGTVDATWAVRIADALTEQLRQKRSLGSGDEGDTLVRSLTASNAEPADLLRSAAAGIALTIAHSLSSHAPEQIIIAGGGAKNAALMNEIKAQFTEIPVQSSDTLNIPVEFREAICMAVLGQLALDQIPITLPQVTHLPGQPPKSGTWTHP